ncbi:Gfo/Idh/MocA family protein [Tautonia marina]|uniref:Gfo/Idh/MocA family protein n=1 Tax=Tautonia marina TaxID=2653855 RepID=UPI00126121DC|nr:Gfo/Idh/MocA family oxidoreductase [Tautonia marina]
MTALTIGIVGCGRAARIHSRRLRDIEAVRITGCVDPEVEAARALASELIGSGGDPASIQAFSDHQQLLADTPPDVLAIFTPPRAHYRPAMDGLQAGCHLFIEKPLSTNTQEAVDIVNLARGRDRVVGVGHQFRLAPSLIEARRLLAEGAIGRLRLVMAVMANSWLATQRGPEGNAWRVDPKVSGGGIIADDGDHLLDALVWTTDRSVAEVSAFQDREEPGLDIVNAITLRLVDGTPATLAITGASPGSLFEITYFGEVGTLRANASSLRLAGADPEAPVQDLPLHSNQTSIDGDFIDAIRSGRPPCCSAEQAIETVRLQEAIARSAASGQIIRLASGDEVL